ncbi:MAG: hypothetical protein BWK80_03445 [Desulfobacteraceae bacterium IS3]|nr:MAG: hypothetical protein BWK80_03445 [Desulfobacteraceae bacterium IS3]
METIRKYYRAERKDIGFLRFIFEACDGIAVLTTLDPAQGRVVLCIAPGCESEAEMVLQCTNIRMEEITEGETTWR